MLFPEMMKKNLEARVAWIEKWIEKWIENDDIKYLSMSPGLPRDEKAVTTTPSTRAALHTIFGAISAVGVVNE